MPPGGPLWGWLGPLLVALFGGFLRFFRLGEPNRIVFDETYYAKDAFSTVKFGVERQFIDGADKVLIAGNTNIFKSCPSVDQCASYVVHPPLGKRMIGLGELILCVNPYGWRFAAALLGTISIFILARVARRMTRTTLLGCLAGLLISLDALHFVLSRTALLDMFLMFWALAGFACLVVDRDRARQRLADWYETSSMNDIGPRLGWRPWRLAAALCLGAAPGPQWARVLFIIGFPIMSFVWGVGGRRALGLRRPYAGAFRFDLPLAAAWMAIVPALIYIVSFAGWFATDKGYGRNWGQATGKGPMFFLIDSMRSWF